MLPQKKSLLRRNAWFRQQYLLPPATQTTAESTTAGEACSHVNRHQPIHFDSAVCRNGVLPTD